ncbi:lymphocyte antigen 75-like isoform X2 [Hemibagrus wyckioides]|uniref:lymphocyte antigen 75-like isoform X2 n=1 Tax=Hemibagrus wyckioides TaxID=337641 RepID=UPI00266DA8CC|nr:lymphocyte antigen 75-like isoform X2 [Hemibagrus wyckioides]
MLAKKKHRATTTVDFKRLDYSYLSIMKIFFLSFIGIVPATLSLLPPDGHQYYVIKTKVTWPVAQNYCRETYGDLATVETDLDWFLLKEEMAREGLTDIVWVGLYNDFDSWRWSFNDVPMKNTFHNWGGLQPNNALGKEACCETGPLGVWWDFPCENLFPFICYNDLAFAITATDNSAIQSVAARQGGSWLGGYRDTWKWSDGTNTSILLWLSGQPDNYYSNENCAVLDKGMFQDTSCTDLNYFICQTTHQVRKKQLIRLHVKSDLSVIGADVQSAIVELVKQKLDEYGMLKNTTVTWRVQSDGQIFHKNKK